MKLKEKESIEICEIENGDEGEEKIEIEIQDETQPFNHIQDNGTNEEPKSNSKDEKIENQIEQTNSKETHIKNVITFSKGTDCMIRTFLFFATLSILVLLILILIAAPIGLGLTVCMLTAKNPTWPMDYNQSEHCQGLEIYLGRIGEFLKFINQNYKKIDVLLLDLLEYLIFFIRLIFALIADLVVQPITIGVMAFSRNLIFVFEGVSSLLFIILQVLLLMFVTILTCTTISISSIDIFHKMQYMSNTRTPICKQNNLIILQDCPILDMWRQLSMNIINIYIGSLQALVDTICWQFDIKL
jgi:hypothetical protein